MNTIKNIRKSKTTLKRTHILHHTFNNLENYYKTMMLPSLCVGVIAGAIGGSLAIMYPNDKENEDIENNKGINKDDVILFGKYVSAGCGTGFLVYLFVPFSPIGLFLLSL